MLLEAGSSASGSEGRQEMVFYRKSGGGCLLHWAEFEHQETSKLSYLNSKLIPTRPYLLTKPHFLIVLLLMGQAYSNHLNSI